MIDLEAEQTAVRQQGDRPTCVAFAVSGAHEWMGDDDAQLSPEDAMWAAHQAMPQQLVGEEIRPVHARGSQGTRARQ
jgi:hypothetical protein